MSHGSMRDPELRGMLPERPVPERLRDHREIHPPFAVEQAAWQASRCGPCGVPYCQISCPLHPTSPTGWRSPARGRFRAAFEVARSSSDKPEICVRICPQDRRPRPPPRSAAP